MTKDVYYTHMISNAADTVRTVVKQIHNYLLEVGETIPPLDKSTITETVQEQHEPTTHKAKTIIHSINEKGMNIK